MLLFYAFFFVILACSSSVNVGHVAIFAPPLIGHIIPLVDFAKKLSMYHHVTFVSSATALDLLKHRGLIFKSETQNSQINQFDIEWISLYDEIIIDFEVSETNR